MKHQQLFTNQHDVMSQNSWHLHEHAAGTSNLASYSQRLSGVLFSPTSKQKRKTVWKSFGYWIFFKNTAQN